MPARPFLLLLCLLLPSLPCLAIQVRLPNGTLVDGDVDIDEGSTVVFKAVDGTRYTLPKSVLQAGAADSGLQASPDSLPISDSLQSTGTPGNVKNRSRQYPFVGASLLQPAGINLAAGILWGRWTLRLAGMIFPNHQGWQVNFGHRVYELDNPMGERLWEQTPFVANLSILAGSYEYSEWWAPIMYSRQAYAGASLDFQFHGWFAEVGFADSVDAGTFSASSQRLIPVLQAGYLYYFDFYK